MSAIDSQSTHSSTQKLHPPTAELGRQPDALWWSTWLAGEAQAALLQTERLGQRHFPTIYDLFRDMMDKDGHLFASVQTRKNGILSRPRRIVPASDSPDDQRVADYIENALHKIPGFEQRLADLLDSIAVGFSVVEILWGVENGHAVVNDLISRSPSRFLFDDRGSLHLLAHTSPAPAVPPLLPASRNRPRGGMAGEPAFPMPFMHPVETKPLPERKFICLKFGETPDSPYGRGLCQRAYWYYWFKKNNLKFWATFNEKFGAPTIIGRFPPGAGEDERGDLLEVIDSIQTATGVTVPESISLELLEATRSGSINTYKDFADWCNDEISKIVLGATLTTTEGRRSGSLALGRIHQRVRSEYVEADARALMSAVNQQLVRWLVDFNFGPDVPAPQWTIDTTEDENLDAEIEVDRQLVALGVPLPLQYFYERYRRPAPVAPEKALRYDDNNLYQYHLQFGVLTINEVRANLGLPPVAWGDRPPMMTAPSSDNDVDEVQVSASRRTTSSSDDPSEAEPEGESVREK